MTVESRYIKFRRIGPLVWVPQITLIIVEPAVYVREPFATVLAESVDFHKNVRGIHCLVTDSSA